MLHLYFDTLENLIARKEFIRYPGVYFDGVWERSWLDSVFGRTLIKTVDHIEVGQDVEFSLLKAGIRVEELSTGVKNLFLCKHLDQLNRMTMMGENCYTLLMEIAEEKDVYMGCSNSVFFHDNVLNGRPVHFINSDVYVTNYAEFLDQVITLAGGGVF